MKLFLLLLTFTLLINHANGQEKLVKYYDWDWNELSKKKGDYVREITIINDSVYFIQDHIRKGMKLIMRGYFKSINPFIEHGSIEYFDEYGNQKMECQYNNGEPSGIWIVRNYFQIAYAELDYNFNLVYQHNTMDSVISVENESTINKSIASETLPEFQGGEAARIKYLSDNTIIPYKCFIRKLGGNVIVGFVINKDGFIENPVIIESSNIIDYDKEAIRIIRDMPQWQPGTQDNKPVDVQFTVPLNFKFNFN